MKTKTKLKHEFDHAGAKYLVTIIDDGTYYTVQGFKNGDAVTPAYKSEIAAARRFDEITQGESVMDLAVFVKDSIQGKTRKL